MINPVNNVSVYSPRVNRIKNNNNILRVNFKGQLQDPSVPSIQFKVRGVSHHQLEGGYGRDRNIEKLADSNWQDERPLSFKVIKNGHENKIIILDPQYGEIGRVPDEITPHIGKLLSKYGHSFKMTLSNIIAGTSKSAPTIGIRANLLYNGDNKMIERRAQQAFDALLNSDDREIKNSVMPYQPKTTPKEVLARIFNAEKEYNGSKSARELLDTIDNISNEITNPKNKNILLLGHNLPDGDTIGCVLGMHAAIKGTYPEKNVVCSIDDKIPGLYRDKLPGIENIKRPYNPETIKNIENNISTLMAEAQTPAIKSQIEAYKNELKYLKRHNVCFDAKPNRIDKFDLVILMDISAPSRFSESYKKYIETADKVIFIDHHPYHYQEWDNAKEQTGLDMEKVQDDDLSLVVPYVPAAAQLVTIVADNAGLLNETFKSQEAAKQYAAAVVSGISSDTGCFARSANLTPEDIAKPVSLRPNLRPEGMSKWIIDRLGNMVNKKWIRENIVYDISDKSDNISLSPRKKMVNYAFKSQKIFPENGVGFININYNQMYELWEMEKQYDKKVSFIDIQNSFKYSEVMGALRESPEIAAKNHASIQPYKSPYQDDKIAILLIQDKKAGCLDSNMNIADKNGIRMSFRSKEGTNYAELLSMMFNGGGHGAAAGGRIDLEGVELNSKVALKVDGSTIYDADEIYAALKENYEIKNNANLTEKEKVKLMHNFETVLDERGKTIQKLINGVVSAIREDCN